MGRALLRFLHLSCDDWYLCPSLYYLRLNQIFIFYFFWILKRFNCNSTLDLHVTQRIGQNLNSRTHKSELCFKAIFWLAVHFPWHFSSVLLWQTSPPKFRVCCPNWCWLLFFFSRFLVMLLMLSYFSKTRLTWHVPIRSDKNTRLVPFWASLSRSLFKLWHLPQNVRLQVQFWILFWAFCHNRSGHQISGRLVKLKIGARSFAKV